MSGGYIFTVALGALGEVRAWGFNFDGQCNVPADLPRCRLVDAGGEFTLALTAPPCRGDLNGDGIVSGADLGLLLGTWGMADGSSANDQNGDGTVDGADLGMLLGDWGPCTD